MKLPKKILPCPISEVIFELKFEANIPEDAVFGIIYDKLKKNFKEFYELPAIQIPTIIRKQDPKLKFAPLYQLKKDNFVINIGCNIFTLNNIKSYCGWDILFKKIKEYYELLKKINIIKKELSYALRYINIFENKNIFHYTTLVIFFKDKRLGDNTLSIITEIPHQYGGTTLKILNNAEVAIEKRIIKGSVIDINTYAKPTKNESFENLINNIHNEEKKIFFSLLEEKFLEENFSPEY